MKNTDTETGESELVLGNKQLLSGFFIIVILFGVFFIMGYILGRNSAPSGTRASSSDQQSAAPSVQAESRPPAVAGSSPPPVSEPPKAVETTPAASEAPAQPSTQPAREPGSEKLSSPTTQSSGPMPLIEPEPGQTFLQVMAVKRPEAEVVARTLKDKGFSASLASGPGDLVRVLVGPYKDTASLGAAKAELENAGFHPIVRR